MFAALLADNQRLKVTQCPRGGNLQLYKPFPLYWFTLILEHSKIKHFLFLFSIFHLHTEKFEPLSLKKDDDNHKYTGEKAQSVMCDVIKIRL